MKTGELTDTKIRKLDIMSNISIIIAFLLYLTNITTTTTIMMLIGISIKMDIMALFNKTPK